MSNKARDALDDKVYDLYPELDMGDIQRMTDEQLTNLINLTRPFNRRLPDQPKPIKQPKLNKPKWKKTSAAHEVRNDQLVIVETWSIDDAFGTTSRERVNLCGTRTMYEGRLIASSILKHYLLTGEWIKRIPKPEKHRAIVRVGKKVMHLGYFATIAEKEAVIFAFKLGIVPHVCYNTCIVTSKE